MASIADLYVKLTEQVSSQVFSSEIQTLTPASSTILSTSTAAVSSHTETSSPTVSTTLDTMVSPKSILPSESVTSTTPSESTTSSIPSSSPTPNPYTFNISISNQRQHVGAWYGTFIRDDLSYLHSQCDAKKTGANTCKTSPKKHNNIEYIDKFSLIERGRSVVVEARVESDYVPEGGGGLQNAFIEQIADTMMLATLDEKNCYHVDRKSQYCLFCKEALCGLPDRRGRIVKQCNAPQSVKVSVVDGEGKEVAHMKVKLEFTGKSERGKFDCVAIRGAVDGNARKERGSKLQDAMGGREVEVGVECEGEELSE